jgi:hypothetical protein
MTIVVMLTHLFNSQYNWETTQDSESMGNERFKEEKLDVLLS